MLGALNELGKFFLHLFIKNMAPRIVKKGGLACPVEKSKRSQLPLCEGSVIGRPLIGGKYEWSDVGKALLRAVIEFYFSVQRLK